MKPLLGSAAFGVSPLALPWGSSACYMQPAGQRRGEERQGFIKKRVCKTTTNTVHNNILF